MESYVKKQKNSKELTGVERKLFVDLDKKISFFIISVLLSFLSIQEKNIFIISAILSLGYLLDFSYLLFSILVGIISGIFLGPMQFIFFSVVLILFSVFVLIFKKVKTNLFVKIGICAFLSDFIARCIFLFINNMVVDFSFLMMSFVNLFVYCLGINSMSLLRHQQVKRVKQSVILSTCLLLILAICGSFSLLNNPTIGYIILSVMLLFMTQILNISLLSYILLTSSIIMYVLFEQSLEQIILLIIPFTLIGVFGQNKKYGAIITYLFTYIFILFVQKYQMLDYKLYLIPLLTILIYIFIPSLVVEEVKEHIFNIETFEKENLMHVKKLELEVVNMLENVSSLFGEIAKEYQSDESCKLLRKQTSMIFQNLCVNCPKSKICYQTSNVDNINLFIKSISFDLSNEDVENIRENCLKPGKFLELSSKYKNNFYREYNFNEQYKNLKQALSYQVLGFKDLMENYANKMKIEQLPFMSETEETIKHTISSLNLNLLFLDTYKEIDDKMVIYLDVEIDDINDIETLIIPSLENALDKSLKIEEIKEVTIEHYYSLKIKEYEPYEFIFGINQRGKEGEINGDSYLNLKTKGSYIFALSDGMGSGKEAKEESKTTLKLLKSILMCGSNITNSIMMINSLLKSKNRYDTYATLDLININEKSLKASVSKNGSPCSYVYRKNRLIKIDSASLPIGIIDKVEVYKDEIQLEENDLIVMFSDGINDDEEKMLLVLKKYKNQHPQIIAKAIMNEFTKQEIKDDTSVMIIKIKKKV